MRTLNFLALCLISILPAAAQTYLSSQGLPRLETGSTLIMDQDLTLTGDLTLPEGVTVIGQGGRFLADRPVALTGTETLLQAPASPLFSTNVEVKGSWRTDCAWPEWFGAKAYASYDQFKQAGGYDKAVCSSDAINRTLQAMDNCAVRFLPGFYILDSPIDCSAYAQLLGTAGPAVNMSDSAAERYATPGTTFVLHPSFRTVPQLGANEQPSLAAHKPYVIGFNVVPVARTVNGRRVCSFEWKTPWTHPFGHIKDIQIKNFMAMTDGETLPIGIAAGASPLIEDLYFVNIPKAVKYDDSHYIDGKRVVNCDYALYATVPFGDADRPYAFDLSGLGDGISFANNHVGGTDQVHALRLSSCGGGSVRDNIINADVEIAGCKGISFDSNHMEEGHQVRILASEVSVRSNLIEKGKKVTFAILGDQYWHTSQVSLSDNVIYYRSMTNRGLTAPAKDPAGKDYLSARSWELDFNPTDFAVSNYSDVRIEDCYRVWFDTSGLGGSYYSGLQGALAEGERENWTGTNIRPLEAFNAQSAWLSQKCRINHGQVSSAETRSLSQPEPLKSNSLSARQTERGFWLASDGQYSYSGRVVRTGIDEPVELDTTQLGTFTCRDNGQGVSIFYQGNRNAMLEITRTSPDGSRHQALVPVCGNTVLHDNGTSLNAYPWQ